MNRDDLARQLDNSRTARSERDESRYLEFSHYARIGGVRHASERMAYRGALDIDISAWAARYLEQE